MRSKHFLLVPAAVSALAALALAAQYPLGPLVAIGTLVLACLVFFKLPHMGLLALPALLPVIGLAPWTGWITFEELDVLILAFAAAGYARIAWSGRHSVRTGGARSPMQRYAVLVWGLVGLFALSTAVAMFRGFADAGGFVFGWYQGYHEPMNSVRLVKGFLLALLVLPLWLTQHRHDPVESQRMLSMGLMLGLCAAAMATIWERAAFTDLLNFSSDYRTTGMFWEMHVGGAALDGFLALTVPFALREWMDARTPLRWWMASAVLALGAYACLTTFSRGVYLAVPVGVAVFLMRGKWHWQSMLPGLLLVGAFGAAAVWMFQSSGYRGMAALLGCFALMLSLAQVLRALKGRGWLVGLVLALLMALLTLAIGLLVPKGAYVGWVLAFTFTAVLLLRGIFFAPLSELVGGAAFGGFCSTLFGTGLIASHWSETAGLVHALPALTGVFAVCVAAGGWRKPIWPEAPRWQGGVVGIMALVAGCIGVMGGGTYMTERFSTGGKDLGGRQAHWQLGRDMLQTPADWWLGKGLGRFPANHFLAGDPSQHPGDYRLVTEGDNSFVILTGGLHTNGWGELFRVSQRVSPPGRSAMVTAKVRADKDLQLHFEVCEKHLLYNQACLIAQAPVKGKKGEWQDLSVELKGEAVGRGNWYAPKLIVFSMAMASQGGVAQLDNLALTGADGQQLLANGDYSDGMARWFFSSDRHHMPWHIKSMYMNVLFDQGIVGLALWGLLVAGAVWRTSVGSARNHPLAPALTGSLVGFAVVGLFDSLLDVPRVAWLFYLLVLIALTLPVVKAQSPLPAASQ